MVQEALEKLKYPIGDFAGIFTWTSLDIKNYIQTIETFPQLLKAEVGTLHQDTLKNRYRPEGWNIAQVVNHCADSHINAFMRFKLALTEDQPTVKPYNETAWAELVDGKNLDITLSLNLIEALHAKWTLLLKSLSDEDFHKMYVHPQYGKTFTLGNILATYDWHCRHHLAHIVNAKANKF
jgi:hypothetical protein